MIKTNGGTTILKIRSGQQKKLDPMPFMARKLPRPEKLKFIQKNTMDVKDSNGNVLAEGDSVQIIKDLKVKGTSATLKRGTIVKNIRLTQDCEEIECNAEKIKGLVLKTCFLKKI